MDEDLDLAAPNVHRLRDHLLGCPAALAACYPVSPIFRDNDELLKHFIVERRADAP